MGKEYILLKKYNIFSSFLLQLNNIMLTPTPLCSFYQHASGRTRLHFFSCSHIKQPAFHIYLTWVVRVTDRAGVLHLLLMAKVPAFTQLIGVPQWFSALYLKQHYKLGLLWFNYILCSDLFRRTKDITENQFVGSCIFLCASHIAGLLFNLNVVFS